MRYEWAPPCTLVVPAAYPEAMNLNLLEYSWAQGLQLALHSLRLAIDNVAGGEALPLEVAVEQLDLFRRVQRLSTIPPSDYYLAHCRTLHTAPASGPTAVAGWKKYARGEPFVRSRNPCNRR